MSSKCNLSKLFGSVARGTSRQLSVTCNDDATSIPDAVVLESGKLHRGSNQAKQDRHHNKAPQPLDELLHLQQHVAQQSAQQRSTNGPADQAGLHKEID